MSSQTEIKSAQTLAICLAGASSKKEALSTLLPLTELGDELLFTASFEVTRRGSKLPKAVRMIRAAAGATLFESYNALVQAAASDWILLLCCEEELAPCDFGRLLSLLSHPIRPCYELPVRVYQSGASVGALPVDLRYQDMASKGEFFLEHWTLRLFPKDAAVYFDGSSVQLNVGAASTLNCGPFRCNVPLHRGLDQSPDLLNYNRQDFNIYGARARAARQPKDPRIFQELGTLYFEAGRLEEALQALSVANQLKSGCPEIINSLAYTCMCLQRYPEASGLWQELVKRYPDYHLAYLNLGVLLMRMQRFATATELFGKALLLQPDDPPSHSNLGICLLHSNRPEEAEKEFRLSISYDPRYLPPLLHLGRMLFSQGRLDQAEAPLRKALELAPAQPEALFGLGQIYLKRGRQEEGMQFWRALLARHPQSPLAQRVQAYFSERQAV